VGLAGDVRLAAAAMAVVATVLFWRLPRFTPTTTLPYPALLGSLLTLWRRHAALRRAAFAQGLLAVAFSAFWSTLAVWLHAPPFGLAARPPAPSAWPAPRAPWRRRWPAALRPARSPRRRRLARCWCLAPSLRCWPCPPWTVGPDCGSSAWPR
jgi:hypothetical protein